MSGYNNVSRQGTQDNEVPKNPTDTSPDPDFPLLTLPETLTSTVLPGKKFLLAPAVLETFSRLCSTHRPYFQAEDHLGMGL